MKNLLLSLFVVLAHLGFASDEEKTLKPLENALWRGTLILSADGHLYTQFLSNNLNENGRIIGFSREKGQFKIDFDLEINFIINDVGEFEYLAAEVFKGDYFLNRQKRSSFKEEVKEDRLKYKQKVQVSKTTLTRIKYEHSAIYDREDMPHGNIRILPSGRLDKKGKLAISGQLAFPYEAKGRITETEERQPMKEGEKPKRTVAKITKSISFPIDFEVNIALEKKPVNGTVLVTSSVKNPFPKDEEDATKTSTYKNGLKFEGTYQLTPLFSKKRKK